MSKSVISFTVYPEGKLVKTSQGATLLEALVAAKVEIIHSCGGGASCGTCRVFIRGGLNTLEARNEPEAEMAQERGFLASERLSCQTLAVDKLELEIPKPLM